MGRKGMSCERTFQAIGEPAELEAKAWLCLSLAKCDALLHTHPAVWHTGLLAAPGRAVPCTSADECVLAELECLPRLA